MATIDRTKLLSALTKKKQIPKPQPVTEGLLPGRTPTGDILAPAITRDIPRPGEAGFIGPLPAPPKVSPYFVEGAKLEPYKKPLLEIKTPSNLESKMIIWEQQAREAFEEKVAALPSPIKETPDEPYFRTPARRIAAVAVGYVEAARKVAKFITGKKIQYGEAEAKAEKLRRDLAERHPIFTTIGHLATYMTPVYGFVPGATNVLEGIRDKEPTRVVGGLAETLLVGKFGKQAGEAFEKLTMRMVKNLRPELGEKEVTRLIVNTLTKHPTYGAAFTWAGTVGEMSLEELKNLTIKDALEITKQGLLAGLIIGGISEGIRIPGTIGKKIPEKYWTKERFIKERKLPEGAITKEEFVKPRAEKPLTEAKKPAMIEPTEKTVLGRLKTYDERIAKAEGEHKTALIESKENFEGRYIDSRTGLLNDKAYEIDKIEPKRQTFYDIDKFRDINEKFGHPTGNKFLKHFGDTLKKYFGEENVYRYGGEEFAVNTSKLTDKQIVDINKQVRAETQKFNIREYNFSSGTGENLYEADASMYYSKETGRGKDSFAKGLKGDKIYESGLAKKTRWLEPGEMERLFRVERRGEIMERKPIVGPKEVRPAREVGRRGAERIPEKPIVSIKKISEKTLGGIAKYARENKGITVGYNGKIKDSGYAFSTLDKVDETHITLDNNFDKNFIKTFNKFKKKYGSDKLANFGGWIDNGKFIVDNSNVSNNLKEVLYDAIIKKQDAIGDLGKYSKGKDGTIFITKDIINSLQPLGRTSFEGSKSSFRSWEEAVEYYKSKNFINSPEVIKDLYEKIGGIYTYKEKIEKVIPEAKPSGPAERLKAEAIKRGLKEITEATETAKYGPKIRAKESKEIADLMSRDIEKAKRIIRGEEPAGKYDAGRLAYMMADYAARTNDGKLLADLINSPIMSEISKAGSELSMLVDIAPDSVMRNLKTADNLLKESKLTKKTILRETKQIEKGMGTVIKDKAKWVNFINSIEC